MQRFAAWIRSRLAERPAWINALMLFCAFHVFLYSPWDIFVKPLAVDRDVWFGVMLAGRAAKVGDFAHFLVYATFLYGFWRMRPWVRPWASLYLFQVAFSMFVWSVEYVGGFRGLVSGALVAAFFCVLAVRLRRSRDFFGNRAADYPMKYGPWAVVTGATAGIGLEFARALAARKVSCVLAARRSDRLEAVAEELRTAYGIQTRTVTVDLAAADGPDTLADAIADLEIGTLVNNAGVGYAGRFEKQELSRLLQMISLNCTAYVALVGRLLPKMLERRRGAIIMVGSAAGRQPVPFHSLYSATKGFELLFGEGLWAEVRDQGVDVLVVQPGPVATEFETVAGETRQDPARDESPQSVVETALEALGRQPSVVTGWMNFFRANVGRVLPRTALVCAASDFMEAQTPASMR